MTEQTRWPQGQQSAVVLTIDFNDIHGILTQTPAVAGRDKTLSVWRYGTLRGVDRLLTLLAEKKVRASWLVPAIVAAENPDVFARIVAAGHEIACSGDRHQNFDTLTLEQQIASVRQGCDQLAAACGARPVGFRTPAGQWKPGLAAALSEAGIRWSSSWRGDDLPYFHPATRLVELPMHYELEDEPYFAFNLSPAVPPGQSRIASYQQTLENMQQDFRGFHRFGLCYVLRLHPEIIGTAGRIGLLAELLDFIAGHQQVWIASAAEVADWWQTQPDNLPEHPAEIFQRQIMEQTP
ncbi:polysaccharide deacetylase [Erwiniaceae bacterium BAC15a-03b]|uniref:Polysaccharide deacetylase n=1 Tax=Winslowiella arboricola TaxID=2978220 RepID=A0A9J6PKZ1_9GAMM|nr:polysaccharide deacetylase [Winslowiella arboricola]MCU5771624.1 polysaccharide deacetylase [Winslowiella arboricola]MCU5776437.1 polysaccharide deacetylase [Winslowiella arboricola]